MVQRLAFLSLLIVPAFGQTSLPETPAFEPMLQQVLAAVNIGTVPSLPPGDGRVPAAFAGRTAPLTLKLPGALVCGSNEVMYSCTWETVPNKYSVAVLLDEIVKRVSAALPDAWSREKGQTTVQRYGEFTDPAGEITITVSCEAIDLRLVPSSYTVNLNVHRAQLRLIDR